MQYLSLVFQCSLALELYHKAVADGIYETVLCCCYERDWTYLHNHVSDSLRMETGELALVRKCNWRDINEMIGVVHLPNISVSSYKVNVRRKVCSQEMVNECDTAIIITSRSNCFRDASRFPLTFDDVISKLPPCRNVIIIGDVYVSSVSLCPLYE